MKAPTQPVRVTPAQIAVLNAAQRTKSVARKAELEASLKKHFAEVATGIPKHHGCRKVEAAPKPITVVPEPRPETKADRVARAAAKVRRLLNRG